VCFQFCLTFIISVVDTFTAFGLKSEVEKIVVDISVVNNKRLYACLFCIISVFLWIIVLKSQKGFSCS